MRSLLTSLNFTPKHLSPQLAWAGHLPFAYLLVSELKPKSIVELGTHSGNSYFTFCQAVKQFKTYTQCYAVDTWKGEKHAGHYDNAIYDLVCKHNQKHYSSFSQLLRTTFDDAALQFSSNSIDLLHIDGLHTYEAVKDDFNTWYPKVSDGGMILFHDICCRHEDFGVWKLWEEIQNQYPQTLSLLHSHGLGVLIKGNDKPKNDFISSLVDPKKSNEWQDFFSYAGQQILNEEKRKETERCIEVRSAEVENHNTEIANLRTEIKRSHEKIAAQVVEINELIQIVRLKNDKITRMQTSFSWKVSSPLRALKRLFGKFRKLR
jgi:hypothetical protein